MQTFKTNIYLKIGVILFVSLLLLIPTSMIRNLIYERQIVQNEAISEVSSKWAGQQTLTGPVLAIPFTRYSKEINPKDSVIRWVQTLDYIYLLPTLLECNGAVNPEKRKRGIYEIVVYNASLNVKASFDAQLLAGLDIPIQQIQFDKAELILGIDDLRGIEEQVTANWNGQQVLFNPGITSPDIARSGMNAHVPLVAAIDSQTYQCEFKLSVKGSQLLYFTPVGKVTDVGIVSGWANPSFNGAFLPDKRTVADSGFTANWNILHLNRNYPQVWTGSKYTVPSSAFGIDLIVPVDNYQKAERAIKYAILFIGFTFLVFFFIEVLQQTYIHPIQYILVGIALIVFYTLLVSISEHVFFNGAFAIAAIATLLLIGGYSRAILKSNPLTMLLVGILTILYGFIFVVIQLQDYALIIGSIGIFVILAIVMYYSRKIDWYAINMDDSKGKSKSDI